jgi:hypothetical protein
VGTADAGSGGRWRPCSGKPAAWPGQQASVGAPVGPREGIGSTVLVATRPEHGVHRGTRGGGNGGLLVLCSLA